MTSKSMAAVNSTIEKITSNYKSENLLSCKNGMHMPLRGMLKFMPKKSKRSSLLIKCRKKRVAYPSLTRDKNGKRYCFF